MPDPFLDEDDLDDEFENDLRDLGDELDDDFDGSLDEIFGGDLDPDVFDDRLDGD